MLCGFTLNEVFPRSSLHLIFLILRSQIKFELDIILRWYRVDKPNLASYAVDSSSISNNIHYWQRNYIRLINFDDLQQFKKVWEPLTVTTYSIHVWQTYNTYIDEIQMFWYIGLQSIDCNRKLVKWISSSNPAKLL